MLQRGAKKKYTKSQNWESRSVKELKEKVRGRDDEEKNENKKSRNTAQSADSCSTG